MHKDKLYFQCRSHFMAIGYWFICFSDGSSMTLCASWIFESRAKINRFYKVKPKGISCPPSFSANPFTFCVKQNKWFARVESYELYPHVRTHTLSRQIHGNLINFNGAHTGAMCFCFPCHIKRLFSPFCFSFLIYFVFVTRVLLLRTLFGSFARPFVYFWFSFIHVSFNSIENIHRLCLVCVYM